MPKIYNDKNVYEAAMERFDIIFTEFNDYYFSVSGGKDSSIMLQLAALPENIRKNFLFYLLI